MKVNNDIWALHGQLQSSEVWQCFKQSGGTWQTPSLLKKHWSNLDEWGKLFAEQVKRKSHAPRILLGYSMGGRLAMWSLCHYPQLWNRAIIVSADPGQSSSEAKQQQFEKDKRWAERFRTEPWNQLMQDWNAQTIFGGLPPQTENIDEKYRNSIAHLMEIFSKGIQPDLTSGLITSEIPITFISGEKDVKYTRIGQNLAAEAPNITHLIVPGVGHRVPWEAKEWFAGWLEQIMMNTVILHRFGDQ